MAVKNSDGSVTVRTQGALAYTPSASSPTVVAKTATALKVGGGGFVQSGRLTRQKGRSVAPKSVL